MLWLKSDDQERIRILQTDNSDQTTMIARLSRSIKEVNTRTDDSQAETNATLEKLIKRVKVLESRDQDSQDEDDMPLSPFTSTQDLASALLVRLENGDELEADTVAQLRLAIGSSSPLDAHPGASAAPRRFPDMPSTDQEPVARMRERERATKRKRAVEQDAPADLAKRASVPAKEPAIKAPSSAPVNKSQPAALAQRRPLLRDKKVGSASDSISTSAASSIAVDAQPISPQPRRTTQEVKPTRR